MTGKFQGVVWADALSDIEDAERWADMEQADGGATLAESRSLWESLGYRVVPLGRSRS